MEERRYGYNLDRVKEKPCGHVLQLELSTRTHELLALSEHFYYLDCGPAMLFPTKRNQRFMEKRLVLVQRARKILKTTVDPLYLQGSTSSDSTNYRSNILEKKIPESSKKQNLNLPHNLHSIFIVFTNIYIAFTLFLQFFTYHLHCIYNYLHSIYIVLGIVSNLEMI